jgi:RNA-directed DNA polymerase
MRQKIQLELAFAAVATGEARSQAAQGTEALAATPGRESQAALGPSMEAIVERDNLKKALVQVRRKRGRPAWTG